MTKSRSACLPSLAAYGAACLAAWIVIIPKSMIAQTSPPSVEMRAFLHVDVDGAPNAYGPPGRKTLDFEKHAHVGGKLTGKIVGYLTHRDGKTPVIQGPRDPKPGYYISTTAFYNRAIDDERNPRRYLDATRVNYVVLGDFAIKHHVRVGDFAAVYSSRSKRSVFALVGDEGNASGCEGSLALVQALGYAITDGKEDSVDDTEITIRYFPHTNPNHTFYETQSAIDAAAKSLGLSKHFDEKASGE